MMPTFLVSDVDKAEPLAGKTVQRSPQHAASSTPPKLGWLRLGLIYNVSSI